MLFKEMISLVVQREASLCAAVWKCPRELLLMYLHWQTCALLKTFYSRFIYVFYEGSCVTNYKQEAVSIGLLTRCNPLVKVDLWIFMLIWITFLSVCVGEPLHQ